MGRRRTTERELLRNPTRKDDETHTGFSRVKRGLQLHWIVGGWGQRRSSTLENRGEELSPPIAGSTRSQTRDAMWSMPTDEEVELQVMIEYVKYVINRLAEDKVDGNDLIGSGSGDGARHQPGDRAGASGRRFLASTSDDSDSLAETASAIATYEVETREHPEFGWRPPIGMHVSDVEEPFHVP